MAKGTRMGLRLTILGVAGALALAACGSGGGSGNSLAKNNVGGYGSIPAPNSSVTKGGVIKYAEQPGAGPNWIFPVIDNQHSSVYTSYEF